MREKLLTWYRAASRDLPFRRTRDPYYIWVSEIMAQQTRITALLPYFERFTARFPTVAVLAAASEDEVLKLWEGLGYYQRARNLQKAARVCVERHGGAVPSELAELRALPGVGDYTAGAVASIAFGQRTPAVDGNVLRVWARVNADPTDIATPLAKKLATAWVLDLMTYDVPTGCVGSGTLPSTWSPGSGDTPAGDMTQALMELGALVCIPQSPRCPECPVRDDCKGAEATELFPVKAAKKLQRVEQRTVLILLDKSGQVWLRQRTERLLHGLWEFPSVTGNWDCAKAWLNTAGIRDGGAVEQGEASHLFTHIRWEMTGYLCRVRGEPPDGLTAWRRDGLSSLAMPTALRFFRKALESNIDFI